MLNHLLTCSNDLAEPDCETARRPARRPTRDTRDPSDRCGGSLPAGSRGSTAAAGPTATLTPTSCNTQIPFFVLQYVATPTQHTPQHRQSPSRTDAGWHRTAVPPAASLQARRLPGAAAWPGRSRPGPPRDRASSGRGWLGRSQPAPYPPPARGGNPERVPPCRSGPSPDLPPAGYGMTRSAQVGAPTEGTPVFISRPDAGLSRRSVSYLWPYPHSAATARQEVQPAAFAVHNRNASTRLPTTTTARLPPPPAERQKPNGQAAAATQNSGGSRGRSRRTLRGAYRLLTPSALSFAPRRAMLKAAAAALAADFLTIWAVARCGCKSTNT